MEKLDTYIVEILWTPNSVMSNRKIKEIGPYVFIGKTRKEIKDIVKDLKEKYKGCITWVYKKDNQLSK